MLELYLPYLLGAIAMAAFQALAGKLGLKLPTPGQPDQPSPSPLPLPLPDGKGGLLLALLQLLLKARTAPQEMRPEERAVVQAVYDLLPDERPK